MPSASKIHSIIMSDSNVGISIPGVSDLIADYAESTPGDRLLEFINKNYQFDGCTYVYKDGGTISLRKLISSESGVTFIMAKIRYIKYDGEWYPFGRFGWGPELTMERLEKYRNHPPHPNGDHNLPPSDYRHILRHLYNSVMDMS